MLMPGTFCCNASVMFIDPVRSICLSSTTLTLAGTLSASTPEVGLAVAVGAVGM